MSEPSDKRPRRPRKVQVGPYKIVPPASRRDVARSSLAERAKRHVRGVAVGHRKVTDPDEEVKILKHSLTPRRPMVPGLLDDDDE